jgi:hypothetical protein
MVGNSLPDVSIEKSEDFDEVDTALSNTTCRSPLADDWSLECSGVVVDLECDSEDGERVSKF